MVQAFWDLPVIHLVAGQLKCIPHKNAWKHKRHQEKNIEA
jgi:hypothetical protein